MRLRNKVVVVTGAARGIGRAIALRFVGEGATVYALDVDEGAPRALTDGTPGSLTVVTCDCADEVSVRQAADRILGEAQPHILVNNAGINPNPRGVSETEPADWDRIMSVNLRSVYLVSRAFLPRMAPGGAVVNIASILGLVGARACSAYTASKGGIIALTRSMARDAAPDIRVNCLCPGAVDTEMFETYLKRAEDPDAERGRIIADIPLGRLGTPDDIAAAAAFLASDAAAWITGSVLVVDGGDSA